MQHESPPTMRWQGAACLLGLLLCLGFGFEGCLPTHPDLTCRKCPCISEDYICKEGFCVRKTGAQSHVQCLVDAGPPEKGLEPEPEPKPEPPVEPPVEPTLEPKAEPTPERGPPEPPIEPPPPGQCIPNKEAGSLKGHTGFVGGLAFLPGTSLLLSSSADRSLRVWDMKTMKLFKRYPLAVYPYGVIVSRDGKWIAFIDEHKVQIWSNQRGALAPHKILDAHKSSSNVYNIAFQGDGKRLVSGSSEKDLFVWNVLTGKHLASLKDTHTPMQIGASSIDYHPTLEQFLVTNYQGPIWIWATDTMSIDKRIYISGLIGQAAYAPDGKKIMYTRVRSDNMGIWHTKTGDEPLFQGKGHTDTVEHIAIAPDSRWAATGSIDKTIRWWTLPGGSNPGGLYHTVKRGDRISAIAIQADGRGMVSANISSNDITYWKCP